MRGGTARVRSGGLVGYGRLGGPAGRSASWPTGPRPSREGVVFLLFVFLFSFHFSNFALLFYLYAHLILFYKIHI